MGGGGGGAPGPTRDSFQRTNPLLEPIRWIPEASGGSGPRYYVNERTKQRCLHYDLPLSAVVLCAGAEWRVVEWKGEKRFQQLGTNLHPVRKLPSA